MRGIFSFFILKKKRKMALTLVTCASFLSAHKPSASKKFFLRQKKIFRLSCRAARFGGGGGGERGASPRGEVKLSRGLGALSERRGVRFCP